jgi:hypothetical protein
MSETPDETQIEPATPDEATPDETTPDTTPDTTEEEEAEEAGQTPQQAAAAHGSDEIPKKLERAISDQRKRLSKIVGVDLAGQECPTCDGMGYTIGGTNPELEFKEDPTKEACPTCNGLGQLISHSKAPGHELVTCIECAGQGWRMKPAEQNVTPIYTAPPISAQQAQMGTMMPDGTFVPFGSAVPAAGQ